MDGANIDDSAPDPNGPHSDDGSSWQVKGKKPPQLAKPSTNSSGKKIQSMDSLARNEMLVAMHSEMATVSKRAAAVVVSGLPSHNDVTDLEQFTNLCIQHLHISPTVKSTVRLGSKREGKMQPLLVHFSSQGDATALLSVARKLRTASNDYIKTCVYINRHLTKAESTAAWESRVNRRKKQSNPNQHSIPNASKDKNDPKSDSTDAPCGSTMNLSAATFLPSVPLSSSSSSSSATSNDTGPNSTARIVPSILRCSAHS